MTAVGARSGFLSRNLMSELMSAAPICQLFPSATRGIASREPLPVSMVTSRPASAYQPRSSASSSGAAGPSHFQSFENRMLVCAAAVAVQRNADISRIGRRMVLLLCDSCRDWDSRVRLSMNAAGHATAAIPVGMLRWYPALEFRRLVAVGTVQCSNRRVDMLPGRPGVDACEVGLEGENILLGLPTDPAGGTRRTSAVPGR